MQVGLPEVTTAAALEEKQKLQKGLGYVDMIFFTAAALIGLDTLGAFSSNGAQALTWLFFSAITFLLPYGLLTAELGSTFTSGDSLRRAIRMSWLPAMPAMLKVLWAISSVTETVREYVPLWFAIVL